MQNFVVLRPEFFACVTQGQPHMVGIDGCRATAHVPRKSGLKSVRRHTYNNAAHLDTCHALGGIHSGAQTVFSGAHVGNLPGCNPSDI